jgi:hypothetical protein
VCASISCIVIAFNQRLQPEKILAFAAFVIVGSALATVVGGALGITLAHAIDPFRQLYDHVFRRDKQSVREEGAPDRSTPPDQQNPSVTRHPEP